MRITPRESSPPPEPPEPTGFVFQPRKPIRYRPRPAAPSAPPPPLAAVVVSATLAPDGTSATLVFDRPLALVGPGPYEMTDAVLFSVDVPLGVALSAPAALTFALDKTLEPGAEWNISAQPAWVATPLAVPQSGELA